MKTFEKYMDDQQFEEFKKRLEEEINSKSWYGVDFDGTLAYHDEEIVQNLGKPVWPMVDQVKKWIAEGKTVKIFTARVSVPENADEMRDKIEQWCEKYIGQKLEVTCIKDIYCIAIYDDKAFHVLRNTGRILS